MTDVWLTPIHKDDAFTSEMLGCIADMWHRMVENYRPNAEWGTRGVASRALRVAEQFSNVTADGGAQDKLYAYPTLSMSLDVKKLLPPEGVKWLFVRAHAKQIKDGRMDAEVTILDESLELVALSQHVSFIIDVAQELKKVQKSKAGKL